MPGPNTGRTKAYLPTEAVAQYRGVIQTDLETCAYPATAADMPLGVTQDECTAENVAEGRAISVMVTGSSFLEASAAIALNARVALTADGKAVTAATGNEVIGIARTAPNGDGELMVVELTIGAGQAPV